MEQAQQQLPLAVPAAAARTTLRAMPPGGAEHEMAAFYESTLELIGRLDPAAVLEEIVTRAAALLGTEHAYLYSVEGDELVVRVGIGHFTDSIGYRLGKGAGVAGRVWESGQPVSTNDYQTLPDRSPDFGWLHAATGVPLRSGDEVVGVIGLGHDEAHRSITPGQLRMLERFARVASVALGNARLYEAAQTELAERTRAEQALRGSEQSFRMMFAHNPHPMWVYDLKTLEFVEVNHAATERYGYSRAEFLSKTIVDIRPAEEVPKLLEYLVDERPMFEVSTSWRHQLKDGRLVDVEIASHAVTVDGRECALVVAFDVTERTRAERALRTTLRQQREARRESEQRARLLATVAGAARAMSSLDPSDVLDVVVDSVLALGLDAAYLCLLDSEGETCRLAHPRGMPQEFEGGVVPASTGMTARVRASGGTVISNDYVNDPEAIAALREVGFRSVIASPVWVQGSLVGALVGASRRVRSLTPQDVEAFELLAAQAGRGLENARRFEDERRTVERLAELDRMKDDFLSTVSHELRTPLTVIQGIGKTMSERWELLDGETRESFFERLNANTLTLDTLIGTLLDFSRLRAGTLTVQPKRNDLSGLLRTVARRLGSLFAGHSLEVAVEDGLVAEIDPMMMDRVVENLLSNAAKHTLPGTSVLLKAVRDGDEAVVSVRDSGAGIPRDEIPRLGERFFRGGNVNTRRTRGVGLGLALVREVLESHGSVLEISSREGAGARFSFRLPISRNA